jgi:hypothetical protein
MQMIDFEYNGEKLSNRNMMLCNFDSNNDTVEIGNNVTITTVRTPNSNKHMAVGYSYDEALVMEFSICKDVCKTDVLSISDTELNGLMRWLNRKKFCKFKPIYNDGSFKDVYFYGTFNVQVVKMGENIVGLNLTLTTNAPFGFVEPSTYTYTFNDENTRFVIKDTSDEIGHLYCNATIKCLEAGDLKISNSLDINNTMSIKNCVAGEIITLYGEQKIIESNKTHKTLRNDFNYNFLRVNNTYENVTNRFAANLSCELSITYSPIRKVGLIV